MEVAMPKENDLEGKQDMGGKHGGQAGVPSSEPIPDDTAAQDKTDAEQKSDTASRRPKGP
jgi:hypothetical protein